MDDFEQQLRNALERKQPPAWLEAKVLAGVSAKRSRPVFLRWAVATVAAGAVAAGVWSDHRAGVQAKEQLQLALKITVTELGKIQKTVRTSTEEE